MRKHFELKVGEGSFAWKCRKKAFAAEAVPDCESLGKVERAFWTIKAFGLEVCPVCHRLESRVRDLLHARILRRDAHAAGMQEANPLRRDRPQLRGLHRHPGRPEMNRTTPAGPKGHEFDLPFSPMPRQAKVPRLLNAETAKHQPLRRKTCQETIQPESRIMYNVQPIMRNLPKELPISRLRPQAVTKCRIQD